VFSTWCANGNICDNCNNWIVMHRNVECEVCSPLFIKNLVCWIWTQFANAFQGLNTISGFFPEFLWSINFSVFFSISFASQFNNLAGRVWRHESQQRLKSHIECGTQNISFENKLHVMKERTNFWWQTFIDKGDFLTSISQFYSLAENVSRICVILI